MFLRGEAWHSVHVETSPLHYTGCSFHGEGKETEAGLLKTEASQTQEVTSHYYIVAQKQNCWRNITLI